MNGYADPHPVSLEEAVGRFRGTAADAWGVDPDFEDMSCEDGVDGEADEAVVAFFDVVASRIAACRGHDGRLRLYRGMHVGDVADFVGRTAALGVGCHWTTTAARAGSHYDTGARGFGREVLLVADVPEESVDWFSTFQANMAHPCEREVFVTGPVRLMEVRDAEDGQVLWRPEADVPTGGYEPPEDTVGWGKW